MSANNTALVSNNDTSTQVTSRTGQSASAFAASLVTSIIIFTVEAILFIIIKDRFTRIYQPRTYLVPEKERTKPADVGWWKWIKPVLNTSNSEFITKCGLDAYFFLRYLRTLLKIFVPLACVILPVLLPINSVGGRGDQYDKGQNTTQGNNVTGLDQLAWGNVATNHTQRYWAHFILAVFVVIYTCYVFFDELRGYIRMRQAYLTSPQHRIRASATTVLVGSIPHKWCTMEALDGLYDVFPGGIRNIWINRNFDELTDKIKQRDKMAINLEQAETDLIKNCWKANEKQKAKDLKKQGAKVSAQQKKDEAANKDLEGAQDAQGHGVSAGNPHQIHHNVEDAVNDEASSSSGDEEGSPEQKERSRIPFPLVGEGIEGLTKGISKVGKGLLGGIKHVEKDVNDAMDTSNGYVPPTEERSQAALRKPIVGSDQRASDIPTDGAADSIPGVQPTKPSLKSSKYDKSRPDVSPQSQVTSEGDWDRGRQMGHQEDADNYPLSETKDIASNNVRPVDGRKKAKEGFLKGALAKVGFGGDDKEPIDYPIAFNQEFETDGEDTTWRKYIKEKDRETMRLPIFGWQWMFSLPLVGQKVDKIYYCRKEVARLNLEIEDDQAHPERYPLMNSAFVQFNHQVAAHMACQAVSHHLPKQMAPRLVEIAPDDVIWDNMSIPWWSRYIRTFLVITIVTGMIILWAIPVAFTGALSQLHSLASQYHWLNWLLNAPDTILAIIQGVAPAAFLALLMFLLPVILRFLVRLQGTQSGMLVELSVQRYYFCFLFVQLFLVVSVSSAASTIIGIITGSQKIENVPNLLAQNIPRASNYFFSYMILQALSVSAGALVQIGALVGWFILAPILDSTARAKFKRQINLNEIKWGTFFPVYTNLAVIGLIYSIISPLILVFNIITFGLFWFVYRYNTLYVTKFTRDTGGLLYPNAINYTFTGLYVMEIVVAILFWLVRDSQGDVACKGQGIGMIVVIVATIAYQVLLNEGFSPLFRYLPITLEDDAVARDEQFARALNKRHGIIDEEEEGENLQDALEDRERAERAEERQAEQIEMQQIESEKAKHRHNSHSSYQFQNPEISMMNVDTTARDRANRFLKAGTHKAADITMINRLPTTAVKARRTSWADRDRNHKSAHFGQPPADSARAVSNSRERSGSHHGNHRRSSQPPARSQSKPNALDPIANTLTTLNNLNPLLGNEKDLESQRAARNELSEALFSGLNDELEDLTPDQRDALVQRAFQHSALRAKRPVIWLPRDKLGVSDGEVRRMGALSRYIWASNSRQGLDSKGRCVYSGAPPDFDEVDLIQL